MIAKQSTKGGTPRYSELDTLCYYLFFRVNIYKETSVCEKGYWSLRPKTITPHARAPQFIYFYFLLGASHIRFTSAPSAFHERPKCWFLVLIFFDCSKWLIMINIFTSAPKLLSLRINLNVNYEQIFPSALNGLSWWLNFLRAPQNKFR